MTLNVGRYVKGIKVLTFHRDDSLQFSAVMKGIDFPQGQMILGKGAHCWTSMISCSLQAPSHGAGMAAITWRWAFYDLRRKGIVIIMCELCVPLICGTHWPSCWQHGESGHSVFMIPPANQASGYCIELWQDKQATELVERRHRPAPHSALPSPNVPFYCYHNSADAICDKSICICTIYEYM